MLAPMNTNDAQKHTSTNDRAQSIVTNTVGHAVGSDKEARSSLASKNTTRQDASRMLRRKW